MKLINIIGARPQFIKVCPILKAIERHNRAHPDRAIQDILVHTGQHYDDNMSAVFFRELEIPEPDYNLGVGSGPQGEQTGEMLKRIEEVLLKERPDMVLVYGDTNSTLAGALAAAKLHIPVAHVEAGLRSFNKKMPEEVNRVLTDYVSDLLFCSTGTAVKNLEREGITQGVYQVGDVMYDSVLYNVGLAEKRSKILEQLKLEPKGYALATVHRAENTDNWQRLRSIFQALDDIAQSGLPVVLPLHPRTERQAESFGIFKDGVRVIPPVSYLDMLILEKKAKLILTDSGGIQKEAYWLGVPCITVREETEWVETIQSGWNHLVKADATAIWEAVMNVQKPEDRRPLYGDGHAAERCVALLDGAQ